MSPGSLILSGLYFTPCPQARRHKAMVYLLQQIMSTGAVLVKKNMRLQRNIKDDDTGVISQQVTLSRADPDQSLPLFC